MEQGSGPALSLMDSSGKLRVALRVGNRQGAYNGLSSWEEAGLVIYGIDGEQAVRLTNIDYSPEGDWPELSFFSTGGPIMRLEGNRGQPGAAFTLRDVSGGTEAQLRVERKGADLRIKRGKDADGVSMHLGQDAADYVQISVNRADGPQVVIKNELGSEVFKKP